MPHRLRDEDLASAGLLLDSRGEDDRFTQEVALIVDGLARVQPPAHPQRLCARLVPSRERALEIDGATNRRGDGAKG